MSSAGITGRIKFSASARATGLHHPEDRFKQSLDGWGYVRFRRWNLYDEAEGLQTL